MEDSVNDRLEGIVDAYLLALERGQTPPSLHKLRETELREAQEVIRLLEAAWNAAALAIPALEDDPVAAELGLVAPRAPVMLNGVAIKVARARQGLSIGDVSRRLIAEGHPTSIRWLFGVEQGSSTPVDATLAEAISRMLGVSLTDITAVAATRKSDSLVAFLRSPRYAEIIRDWAVRLGLAADTLRARYSPLLMAAPRRDRGDADEDEWARLLIALLESGKL